MPNASPGVKVRTLAPGSCRAGKAGPEKPLPWAWLLAELGGPELPPTAEATPAQIAAARHALTCGEIAELLASTREPMSASRFWSNLVGSVRRTRLAIPADPVEAEAAFCAEN